MRVGGSGYLSEFLLFVPTYSSGICSILYQWRGAGKIEKYESHFWYECLLEWPSSVFCLLTFEVPKHLRFNIEGKLCSSRRAIKAEANFFHVTRSQLLFCFIMHLILYKTTTVVEDPSPMRGDTLNTLLRKSVSNKKKTKRNTTSDQKRQTVKANGEITIIEL